jgi:hypothetical protein
MEKTTIVGNGCGVLGIWSITVHPSHIVPGQQQMHFPIQFLFRGFGANFVTLLTTQLQILLHFGLTPLKLEDEAGLVFRVRKFKTAILGFGLYNCTGRQK